MPKRKIQLVPGEFYHIIQKGIDGRKIFLDREDHFRFTNGLLVYNDVKPTPWQERVFWHQRDPESLRLGDYRAENPLVEIHTFTLMPNHTHFILKELIENGIIKFMMKLGGFVRFSNKKYGRKGPLFEDRYQAVLIKDDAQLKNTFVYVNTNQVGIIEPHWKEEGIKNLPKALQFLEEYSWSSCRDFIGIETFPQILTKDFFLRLFGSQENCRHEFENWLKFKRDIARQIEKSIN